VCVLQCVCVCVYSVSVRLGDTCTTKSVSRRLSTTSPSRVPNPHSPPPRVLFSATLRHFTLLHPPFTHLDEVVEHRRGDVLMVRDCLLLVLQREVQEPLETVAERAVPKVVD